jgi:hypothetical protein
MMSTLPSLRAAASEVSSATGLAALFQPPTMLCGVRELTCSAWHTLGDASKDQCKGTTKCAVPSDSALKQ